MDAKEQRREVHHLIAEAQRELEAIKKAVEQRSDSLAQRIERLPETDEPAPRHRSLRSRLQMISRSVSSF